MTCPHCHFELNDRAQFCSSCGSRVAPAVSLDAKTLISAQPENAAQVESDDATLVRATVAEFAPVASSPAPRIHDPLIGVVLDNRYRLTGHVGHGGMGTVYRARRIALGDDVAIKILHRQFVAQPQMLDRFRREARAAAMLHHPNIVAIYDFGDLATGANNSANGEGIPAYIVMELLQGETLGALLKREGKLAPARAVRILREVCAGVGAAHTQGIVHRDLKPDNIIVLPPAANHLSLADDEDEARLSVKVVDFGIAKLRDMTGEGNAATFTHVGTMLGTPSYMSPEQCRGEHLDTRADVYSLGAIAYELLTGRTPFTAPTANGVIAKHLTENPPPLRLETISAFGYDTELVTRFDAVIRRALAKDPAARQAMPRVSRANWSRHSARRKLTPQP
jgi:serine/threonine-protein kinase